MQPHLLSIGVIGGMGPASTNLFLSKVIALYNIQLNAENNNQFPQIIMYNIPDSDHMGNALEQRMFNYLDNAINIFSQAQVDFIVAPCNTVYNYFVDSKFRCNIPIISIAKSVEALYSRQFMNKALLFLSTKLTTNSQLYLQMFKNYNTDVIYLDLSDQKLLNNLILKCNGGNIPENGKNILDNIINKYKTAQVLFACTELSLISYDKPGINIFDSLTALSIATFQVSSQQKSIESYLC